MPFMRQKRNEHSACRPVPDQRNSDLVEVEEAEAEAVTEVVAVEDAAVVADEVTVVEEDAVAGAGDDVQCRHRLKSYTCSYASSCDSAQFHNGGTEALRSVRG